MEEIAQKIKDGKTADILSMNLDTVTLEQAQCIAELIDSGKIHLGKRSLQSPEAGSSANKRQKLDSKVVTVESDEESTAQYVKEDADSIADKIDKSESWSCVYSSKILYSFLVTNVHSFLPSKCHSLNQPNFR